MNNNTNATSISITKNNFTLTITANAFAKLSEVFKTKSKDTFFKLSISSGGCSGFLTSFLLDNSYNAEEEILLEFDNNIRIVVHSAIAELIGKAELHYKQDVINSYFALNVAAAKEQCSCGSSFSI